MQVLNENGNSVGEIEVNSDKFNKIRMTLLRNVVNMYENNKRGGNASTKTRSEVSGSGKKPWAQKHLGRARAGSKRSPVWRGGGVVFGPRPRDYSVRIPEKARRKALNSALTSKFSDNEVVVIDKLHFENPSTKNMVQILGKLNINSRCLIIISEANECVWKSARNIPFVDVKAVADLNAQNVLACNKLLITQDAMNSINVNL